MPEFDVSGFLSGDPLVLHGVPSEKHPGGATYTVAPPCAEDELRMRRIAQLQERQPDGHAALVAKEITALLATGGEGEPLTFAVKMLGADVHARMIADGVTPTVVDKLAQLAMTNYGVNESMARLVVDVAAGEAAARSANRATRRAAAKSTPRKQTGSAAKGGSKSTRQARPASSASRTRSTPASTRKSATAASPAKAATATA